MVGVVMVVLLVVELLLAAPNKTCDSVDKTQNRSALRANTFVKLGRCLGCDADTAGTGGIIVDGRAGAVVASKGNASTRPLFTIAMK